MNDLLEKLAAIEHQQWAHWTKYMLNKLGYSRHTRNVDVIHWREQIATHYERLSEKEKESDRAIRPQGGKASQQPTCGIGDARDRQGKREKEIHLRPAHRSEPSVRLTAQWD